MSGSYDGRNRQGAKTPRRRRDLGGGDKRGEEFEGKEPGEVLDAVAHAVIGAAIDVHRELGPGYLESVYEEAPSIELGVRSISFVRQSPFAIVYKGVRGGEGRIDLLVSNALVVELKTVESLLPVHRAQALSYLKALDLRLALLINFKVPVLRDGLQRVVRSR